VNIEIGFPFVFRNLSLVDDHSTSDGHFDLNFLYFLLWYTLRVIG
jgi:hypothetical protein